MSAWVLPLVPVAGAGAVLAVRRREGAPGPVAVAAVAATLVLAVLAAGTGATGGWRWSGPLSLGLAVEDLARVMVVLVPAIALPVVAAAAAGSRGEAGQPRLLALLLAFLGAMLVLVAAADLLTLLVAWELVAATSWALIAFEWRDGERPRLALQAYLTTRVGDLGLVAAAAVAVVATGGSYVTLARLEGWPAQVVAAGLLLAATAKSAQLPFSPWLFPAMAGPTPVSALLHSATMVAAGAYVLARTVPLLEGAPWLAGAVAGIGLATAVAGGLVAGTQRDLKRALAASTSAQYGLVLVAVGAGSTAAAGAHLVTHATFKALLFLAAGVALHHAGTLDLARLRLGTALPFAAAAFAVGAAALAAVPPLGAAWSKEEILAAGASRGAWLGAGVLAASFLSAVYAGRLAVLAFGPAPGGGAPLVGTRGGSAASRLHEPGGSGTSRSERAALAGLALASVALGALWLPGAAGTVEQASGGRLIEGAGWELPASLVAVAAAMGLLVALDRSSALVSLGMPDRARAAVAGWLGLPVAARALVVDPVLALSRRLATFDDRVVDAGIRATARVPVALSTVLSWWGERGVDGLVHAVAGSTLRAATGTRVVDERAVDRAVEDLARGAGVAGQRSRRLQTGLSHHYYVLVALGLVTLIAVAALGRS